MKKILSITAFILCATLASCDKDSVNDTAQGALTLQLGVNDDYTDVDTRAAMNDTELRQQATIKIYNGDFSGLIREYTGSSKPATIYLPIGNYRVDVEAGESVKPNPRLATWEQRSFKGSKSFDITTGKTTAVSVTARVCNVITEVWFNDSVDESFSDYSFTIGLSDTDPAQQLVYDSTIEEGTPGYFIADGFEPSLYWTFAGTLTDGNQFEKKGEIKAVETGKAYIMHLNYTEKNGRLSLDVLAVDKTTDDRDDGIIFEPVSTGVSKSPIYEIWAGHATVHADVDEDTYDPASVRFEYRKAETGARAEAGWTSVAADRKEEGVFYKRLTGLTPATKYEYRLLAKERTAADAEVIGEVVTFTTEAAPTVPNMGFETAKKSVESSKYYSFYDPASSVAAEQTKWWDSGNAGSTTVGSNTICDPDTENYKEGKQSAYLHSEYVVIKLAAGNLFSGEFAGVVGTKGGKVNFGRPFTGRPTGLRLWVKYSTDKISDINGFPADDKVTKDDYDRAQIKIALGTWNYRTYGGTSDCPVQINTTDESTFARFSKEDESTIAFGSHILQGDASNSTNEWRQITIPFEYKNTTTYPTHIIISCAASMLGDYFTGCRTSKLWVDGMELLYE